MNYYEVLNVRRNCSQAEIIDSYNRLMKKFDPETYNGDLEFAKSRRAALTEAYIALSNPSNRKDFDRKQYAHTKMHNEVDDIYKPYYKPGGPAPHIHEDAQFANARYKEFTQHISDDPYSDPIIDYEDNRITFDADSNKTNPIGADYSTIKLIVFLFVVYVLISQFWPWLKECYEIIMGI